MSHEFGAKRPQTQEDSCRKWGPYIGGLMNLYNKTFNDEPQPHASTSAHHTSPHPFNYPQINKPAPAFGGTAVVNGQFKEIRLSDFKGKYLLVLVYNKFSDIKAEFVQRTEISSFSDKSEKFGEKNCQILAVLSTDSTESFNRMLELPFEFGGLGSLKIPLMVGNNEQIFRDYGVHSDAPLGGLFLIDNKQNLRLITISELYVGRSVGETLRLVQAFQRFDDSGKECPVGWQPEDANESNSDSSNDS